MANPFLEVFPTLQLHKDVADLLEEVQVLRISSTKQRDFLRIYIESRRLIEKEVIFKVEREIKKQLFPNNSITIKIYEKFVLSNQYTPKTLFQVYRESILLELREYSPVLYTMLKQSQIRFTDDGQVSLALEDTVTGRMKAEELTDILEKIFHERCGLPILIHTSYQEKKKNEHEEDDIKIARQVAEIVSRAENGRKDTFGEEGAIQEKASGYEGAAEKNGAHTFEKTDKKLAKAN